MCGCCGFCFKVEDPLGRGDDTALNGIRLHCVEIFQGSSHSYPSVQSDGRWTDIKWCPSGFLTAFQLRVEKSQGDGDDTAANNIMFKCSGGPLLQGDGTRWGDWGRWSQTCEGKGICGIKTRLEKPRGQGDDTALNDVRMFCCN
uniref:Vitelline membrane outer layer protein 1 homolog n=1 Tax=Sinocyclocheilus grahami TaxID=75366 RepID=A0A672S719_SINGR